jgi:hypothetical protein
MPARRIVTAIIIVVCLPLITFASTSQQLQSASENGQMAFVLVTDPSTRGVDQAKQLIQEAMTQVPGSVIIESNRADASNLEFVNKYRLSTAPLPLILVFTSDGIIAGGNIATKLNLQKLLDMVPSPKKAEILKAIQTGHSIYLTAFRPDMTSKSQVTKCCAAACSQMTGKGATIEVNMDDPAEEDLLKQLRVDMNSKEPVTVVINAKGQVTGSYTGAVEVDKLISSATKVVASGCCPSGSGASCGPTTKKSGGK